MNPSTSRGLQIPQPILNRMHAAIRRIRRIVLLRGLLAVAAVALGAILCVMAVDAATMIFSTAVRWGMTLAALGAVLAAVYVFLIRPLAEKWSPQRVARLLETRHPEMEESISSAIELLAADDPAMYRGSASLLARLAEEASRDVGLVSPDQEFTMRTAKPYRIALLAAAGVLVLLFVQSPATTARLLARAVLPSLRLGNAYAGTLTVTPEHATIPVGEAVTIRARIGDARPVRAELLSEFPDGTATVERMQREDDMGGNRYRVALPSVRQSFRYRVRAGRALSGYCRIDVVPRPAVERLIITRHHPAYTGRGTEREDVTEADQIRVLAGTEVEFEAQLNKQVASAELLMRNEPVSGGRGPVGDAAPLWQWTFPVAPAAEPVPLLVRLTDRHGFVNRPRARKLVVFRDEAPTIEIVEPSAPGLRMQPKDILPVLYLAGDDFGIGKVEMLVGVDGKALAPRLLPPPVRQESERPGWLGRAVLDLASLPLAAARVLTVQLAVADVLPADRAGPQQALSKIVTIQIDHRAESLAKQTLGAQAAAIRQALDSTAKRLQEAGKQAEAKITAPLARKRELTDPVRKAADEVQKHAAIAEAALNELSEKVRETAFAKLAPKMQETAQEDIAAARKAAELMQLTEKPEDPAAMAATIAGKLDEALAAVEELKRDLDDTARQADYLADLADIAEKERQLAQAAAAAAATPDEEAPDTLQQQQELAGQLARLANENPEALGQQLAEQLRQAQEMARDATALAARQEGARQAELAIDDPAKHAQADEALRALETAPPEANLDRRLAQAQRQIDADAQRLAGQADKLNEMGRNLAMDPEARKALEQAAQALNQAQDHAAAAADALQARGEPAAETPGEAKRALEQAAAEARRQAAGQAQQAAREKEDARLANAAAMKANKAAADAEKAALAADAANKPAGEQAAQAARKAAAQAQQEAERQMREATAAQQASTGAAERAQQAEEAVQAVEKQQAAAKKAMEGAAERLQRMGKELAAQLGDLEALQAQWQAQEAQEAALAAQQQAQAAQQAARQAQQQAQEAAQAAQQAARQAPQQPQEANAAEPSVPPAAVAAAAAAHEAQQTAEQKQQAAAAAQQSATAAQQEAHAAAESRGAAQAALRQAERAMQQAQRAQQQAAQSQEAAAQTQAQQPGQPGQTEQMQQHAQQAQNAAQQAQQQALAAQRQAAAKLADSAIPQQGQRAEQVGEMLAGQELVEALASAQAASQPPAAPTPGQASRQMAQAAQQAATQVEALAQQAARNMGMPASQMAQALAKSDSAAPPAPNSDNPDGKGNQSTEEWQDIPMALRSLGISLADWIRISGWLRSEVASEGSRNTSPEYRDLVTRYFREVARRGGALAEPAPDIGKQAK